MRHIPSVLVLLAVGALAAAGCAGGGGGRPSSAAQAAPATTAAPATMAGDATATTAGGGRGGYGGGGYGSDQPATTAAKAGGSASGGAVRIAGLAFAPGTLTARVGQKVTWRNQDAGVTHTVTAVDGSFASGQLAAGDVFSQVFRRAGTFAYHCSIHPSMRGTVKVAG